MNDMFLELSDEQLDEYVKGAMPFDSQNYSIACEFRDRVDKLYRKIIVNADKIKDIQRLYSEKNIDEVDKRLASLSKGLSSCATEAGWIPIDFGINAAGRKLVPTKAKNIKFIKNEDCLDILLPELLPHRMRYDSRNKEMRYYYDYDEWYSSYLLAFQKEFEFGKYRMWNDKVTIMYIHHIAKDVNIKDVDNFETKDITDIISMFLLVDDSWKYMSQYSDIVESEVSYTEIIILPQDKLQDKLNEIKNKN